MSEAGANVVIAEFILLGVLCFFLVRYYAAPMVSFDVIVAVYTVYILGFAGILLLPYDLSVAIVDDSRSTIMQGVWMVVYWSTFLFAWVVMPILMDYHGSGHFTLKDKLLDAVYRLLRTWAIFLVLGVSYIIYMVSTSGGSFKEVIGFVMAMGNTYGAFLITFLMGNGLVAVPKQLWQMADNERELMNLYMAAPFVEDSYQDARYELEDCELEVQKLVDIIERTGLDSALAQDINKYVTVLSHKVNSFKFDQRSKSRSYSSRAKRAAALPPQEEVDKITNMAYLVRLHQRLMIAQLKARACERRWRVLVQECDRCQTLSSGGDLSHHYGEWCPMPTDTDSGRGGDKTCVGRWLCCTSIISNSHVYRTMVVYTNSLYLLWRTRFFSHSCRAAAVLCGLGSLLILWCELVMSSNMDSPIGLMMTAYSYQEPSPAVVQAVSFMALAYMSICTYSPLFRINIGFSFRLQGPQQSPPSSLIFNGKFLSRLQFALGYNFLSAINVSRTSKTAFSHLLRHINIIPLFGTKFSTYVPLTMIVIALLTFFDSFERAVKFIGVEMEESVSMYGGYSCGRIREEDMNPEMQEKIKAGKTIVANAIKHMLAQHPSSNNLSDSSNHSSRSSNLSGSASAANTIPSTPTIGTEGRGAGGWRAGAGIGAVTMLQRFVGNSTPEDSSGRIDDDDLELSSNGSSRARGVDSGVPPSLFFSRYDRLPQQSSSDHNSSHGLTGGNSGLAGSACNPMIREASIGDGSSAKGAAAKAPSVDLFSISTDENNQVYGGRYTDL